MLNTYPDVLFLSPKSLPKSPFVQPTSLESAIALVKNTIPNGRVSTSRKVQFHSAPS